MYLKWKLSNLVTAERDLTNRLRVKTDRGI